MSITAILTVYRRPELLKKQVKALESQTRPPDHIWIWQNKSPENHQVKPPQRTILINSGYNFLYHGRFALGLLAQAHSEYVVFFDDDIIPGADWLENCMNCMFTQPGLYVGVGNRLIKKEKEGQKRPWFGWRNPNDKIEEVDYGGHSWFLKSDWLRYFWAEKPVSMKNAEDIQLSFALQKNGIPTYCPPHPKNNTRLWSNIVAWKYGKMAVASHKNPPTGIEVKDWFRERRDIEQKCIQRGWAPMYMRKGENSK